MFNLMFVWFFWNILYTDSLARIIPFLPVSDSKKHPLSPSGQCSIELWKLERQLRQTVYPFRIRGHWVSTHCEIRPGPTFVLRDYQFYETGSFMLRQYFYEDPECSKPKLAFVAHGRLKHLAKSWLVPGASEASWQLNEVSVIPYTKKSGRGLTDRLRKHCRPEPHKEFPWPVLEEYRQLLIFKKYFYPEELTLDPGMVHLSGKNETDEIDCTTALNFTASELSLLRMEEKQLEKSNFFVKEFYVGLPVWDSHAGAIKMPTQFQDPLRKVDEVSADCKTCSRVKESNQLSPPLLRNRDKVKGSGSKFPIYQLDGSWLSTRCEPHASGMFAHRQLTFSSDSLRWELRQRHYNDPLCRYPSYTFTAEGEFRILSRVDPLPETWSLLYKVSKAKLVPESRLTARNLRHTPDCGPSRIWRKGKITDITDFGGCLPLGIQVPAATRDILKVTRKTGEQWTLYTGDNVNSDSGQTEPTSFRPPMEKCDEMTVVISLVAEDYVQDGREKYSMWKSDSATVSRMCSLVLFCAVLLLCLNSL